MLLVHTRNMYYLGTMIWLYLLSRVSSSWLSLSVLEEDKPYFATISINSIRFFSISSISSCLVANVEFPSFFQFVTLLY